MRFFSIAQMMINAVTKPRQHILLQEIPPGRMIDIGGGGEGVIARVGGPRVVPVDKYLSEIHEARGNAPAAHWMVADATTLPCNQQSFDHATAFFSCMYMPADVQRKVFRETYRVLKPNGEFWVWDVDMASKSKVCAVRLHVALPDKQIINTIYGVRAKDQSADGLSRLLQEAGFETEIITDQKRWFLIKAKKAA